LFGIELRLLNEFFKAFAISASAALRGSLAFYVPAVMPAVSLIFSCVLFAALGFDKVAAQDFGPDAGQESEPPGPKDERIPGFTFCAPPNPAKCVDSVSKGKSDAACEEEVRIYVQTVFAYRACLSFETQRAIRETNDLLDRWKCKKSGGKCRK
jgi:hypothetical protein